MVKRRASTTSSPSSPKARNRGRVYGSRNRRTLSEAPSIVEQIDDDIHSSSSSSSSEEIKEIVKPIRNTRRRISGKAKMDDDYEGEKEIVIEIPDEDEESESIVSSALSSLSSLQTNSVIGRSSRIISVSKKPSPTTPSSKIKKKNSSATSTPVQSNTRLKKNDSSTKPKELSKHFNSDNKNDSNDSMEEIDVIIPPSLWNSSTSGECTVMIQVEPEDAPTLEFHGASGAVGRFEADDSGVTMDIKGFQYSGMIQPGPTAMIISMHPWQSTSVSSSNGGPVLKVESITDEFVTLKKSLDTMATLDAVVEKGDMDESYFSKEINVNMKERPGSKDIADGKGKEEEHTKKTPTKKKKSTTQTAKKDSIKKEKKKSTTIKKR